MCEGAERLLGNRRLSRALLLERNTDVENDPDAEELSNMVSDLRSIIEKTAGASAEEKAQLMQAASHLRSHFENQLKRITSARLP